VNTVMNLRVPQYVGKFLSNCATGGFSRRAELHGVMNDGFRINVSVAYFMTLSHTIIVQRMKRLRSPD
jgi:hypothetical protein